MQPGTASGRAFVRLEEVESQAEVPTKRTVSCGGIIMPLGVAVHRALVCAFAVALLWCTSLAVSRRLTGTFVTSPSFRTVRHECQRTYDEVKRQRSAHLDCTKRQTGACKAALQVSLETETRRSHAAAEANRRLLAAAVVRQARCSRRQLQALDNVQRLQAAGVPLRWRDGGLCPAAERSKAQEMVGDISAARSRAMDIATRYTQNVQLFQQMSLDSLDGVHSYDESFMGRKRATLRELPHRLDAVASAQAARMHGTLEQLNQSMLLCDEASAAGGGGGGGGGPSATCELPLQPQVEMMRSQYDALLTAMGEQQSELVSFHASMESMAASIKGPLDTIRKLAHQIDPGIHLPAISVPEVHMPEVHLPPLPSIKDLKAELARWSNERQRSAQHLLSEAIGSSDALPAQVQGVAGNVDGLLDDYKPPQFNTTAARAQMEGETERFLQEQKGALSAFAAHHALLDGLDANSSRGANASLDELNSHLPLLLQQSGLEFEAFAPTDLDFDLLSLALGHVAWIATACDIVWRTWRSVRLVLYYWSRASVGLPTIDLREDTTSKAAANACAEMGRSPHRLLSACFLSPASGAAIIGFALFLTLNAATALYVPMYMSYVDGCIDPPRNGTFISRNLFSTAYNYAATEGNQQLLHGLDTIGLSRAANCSSELRESVATQRTLERDAAAAQAAYKSALTDVRLMRSCLRLGSLDIAAARAGLQPYVPLEAILGEDACGGGVGGVLAESDTPPRLEDGIYNCSAVPPCERVCDGPSRDITAAFCQRCGCHAEWFGHGIILHALLAFFVFASINAWRYLVVDAVCRILWRSIFAGHFEYLANCDDCGNTKVGRQELLEALRDAVRGHVRSGWMMLVGACALNVPWILALTYVGNHLDVGYAVSPGSLS